MNRRNSDTAEKDQQAGLSKAADESTTPWLFTRRRALALAAGAIIVAACGSDDDGDSSANTTAPRPDGGPATTTDGSGSGIPEISQYDLTATFRYQDQRGPSRFDAHKSASSFDNAILFLTYDRLVHNDPDGKAIPGLATEWTFNDDATSLTLKLREGVTFHDGEPFDAAAVKANIERGQSVEESAVAPDLEVITSVEVVDDFTVRLNLNGNAASLPQVLSDRPGMMISPAAFENNDLDLAPVGAGMFTVTDYRPDDRVVFTRYDNYWDPDAVRCATIEYSVAADATARLNAIRTGTIDATFLDANQLPDAEAAGLVVELGPNLGFLHMQPDRSYEPFGKLEVRQAMNHAVDRNAIVQGLFDGVGYPNCQVFPEGYQAFSEVTGSDLYPYDVEKARSLMAAAGYADGFEFDMILPNVIGELGEAIKAQFGEIGIIANIITVDPAQTPTIFYVEGRGHAAMTAWGGRPDPSQTLVLLFTPDGFNNRGGHTTPEVEAAIQETLAVQSEDERAEAFKAASAAVAEAALDIPLFSRVTPTVLSEDVLGWQNWTSGKPEFRYVGVRKA